MSLKLFLFIGLIALTTIEAKHFLKQLQQKEKDLISSIQTSEKALNLVRKRRDAEESNSSESVELTDEEAKEFAKYFMTAVWEGEKQELLGNLMQYMSGTDNNVTVVGWQRILDEQGKVKEIRSVQLVIPPKPEPDRPYNIVQDDDDDDDDDDDRAIPYKEINEIKEVFEPMASINIPASMTYEEFTNDGKQKNLMYMDKDELYINAEGFSIYNKTSVASQDEIGEFISKLKPTTLGKPSILKYDVDGQLLVDQSHIRPQLLGNVVDHYEAPDNILREAPEIIAEIAYQYPQNEIAKQLSKKYNEIYPEYKWRVLVDPENYYITRDVEVTVSYDNFDLDENSDISFLVYGNKKSTK